MNVTVLSSEHSVFFENIYGENPDERHQQVWTETGSFTVKQLHNAEAGIFHLEALLADDLSLEVVKYLSSKRRVSVDALGCHPH
jgi:hypothetical protein